MKIEVACSNLLVLVFVLVDDDIDKDLKLNSEIEKMSASERNPTPMFLFFFGCLVSQSVGWLVGGGGGSVRKK